MIRLKEGIAIDAEDLEAVTESLRAVAEGAQS